MTVEIQSTPGGAILYDSSRVRKPVPELFDTAFWEGSGKIVARAQGRGGVIFVRDDDREWVVRHYRRGGLIAKLVEDVYWWTGAENTRAFREWRLLHELHRQGLPVPAPVATRYVRTVFFYRADLITQTLPPARTLADCITGAVLREDAWHAIGRTIARFHRAGVHHADLNAHNILLGEGGVVFVLDFDRGRIRARGAWEGQVLDRLKRSLLKIQRQRSGVNFNERDWEGLVEEATSRLLGSC